jgi:predicted metal-dependent hydrolase
MSAGDDTFDERETYLRGIALFNDHEFFEAHEVWEDVWNAAYGIKHEFYQGMIQCAVALEHYRRSNARGVLSLFKSYNRHFRDVPPQFMGLDVKQFLAQMHEALRPVLEASPVPQKGSIMLDHSRVPRIDLIYDPFASGEAAKYDRPQQF